MTKVFLSLIFLTQICYSQNFISVDDEFLPQSGSGISIADFNNDDLQDVLICGNNTDGQRVCYSYLNNGDFDFELIEENSISGVVGDHDFGDVDNDGDPDLLVIGQNFNFVRIAELYLNDGNGIFTENAEQEFTGVTAGDVRFGDLDGDGDQDLMISGSGNGSIPYTTLYWNDGSGGFTEDMTTDFLQIKEGSIDFADIDGDDDLDILITGGDAFSEGHTLIYENNSPNQDFSLLQDTPFVQLRGGEATFFDIDKDNDMDIMLLGLTGSNLDFVVNLYLNDGDGNYEAQSDFISLNPLTRAAFEVLDFDNDGDNDIVIIGEEGDVNIIKLFANDGNTNFSEVEDVSPFLGAAVGDLGVADLDGDLDQDIIVVGRNSDLEKVSILYINDGPPITSNTEISTLENLDYSVSPNPVAGNELLHIFSKNSNSQNITIELVDIHGKTLLRENFIGKTNETDCYISVENLINGVYFLHIMDSKTYRTERKKIIKY